MTYESPNLPTSPLDPTLRVGFCVNCEATRELREQGDCSKCGSNSIWTPNAVKEFYKLGAKLVREDE